MEGASKIPSFGGMGGFKPSGSLPLAPRPDRSSPKIFQKFFPVELSYGAKDVRMRDRDAALATLAQKGEAAAFESLIRTHQDMVHALTYRMTGSMADADDLAQETFLRAFEQIHSFRAEAKFSTWLFRIAVNTCLNWRQRETRRREIYTAWAESSEALRETAAPPNETDEVQAALLKLPPKQRAALVLTICEGLDHREAAKALGCSVATLGWRVFAAKAKLKSLLSKAAARRAP
jgi:RNA polymerase sigma-70 factor (ECF subfamily)